jgi:hypothetical protein
MPTLSDVYQKFGEASEAAQLLKTELGTMLLFLHAVEDGLVRVSDGGLEIEKDPTRAIDILDKINRTTLGRLLKMIKSKYQLIETMEQLLWEALGERNRLQHHFYRQHNFRRNSDEGRAIMLADLESIHEVILKAYKAVMLIGGIDLDTISLPALPTTHVPI